MCGPGQVLIFLCLNIPICKIDPIITGLLHGTGVSLWGVGTHDVPRTEPGMQEKLQVLGIMATGARIRPRIKSWFCKIFSKWPWKWLASLVLSFFIWRMRVTVGHVPKGSCGGDSIMWGNIANWEQLLGFALSSILLVQCIQGVDTRGRQTNAVVLTSCTNSLILFPSRSGA